MHVGLNLVYLVPGETGGMETVARELIPALVAEAPDVRFTAFVNREAAEVGDGPWGDLVPMEIVPVRARSRVQWVRGEQQHLPRMAARARVDVLHSLASTAPLRGGFRRVVTVHDLIYLHVPESHFGPRASAMRVLVGAAVRRAHRVMADSENTRRDLVERLGAPEERIDVVPLGVAPVRPGEGQPEGEVRDRHGLGDRRVVLSVSAKRPHKNLARLLEALALIPAYSRPVLVLPGYPTPYEAELVARAAELGLTDDVRFLGWVSAPELEALYAVASCFVFPSLYEGFGLPVLEAMQRGVPVACSSASSLPEVAGDAAVLFDPLDVPAMAAAIVRLLDDDAGADRLRVAGRARAHRFTWEATARATLASYGRTLDPGPG